MERSHAIAAILVLNLVACSAGGVGPSTAAVAARTDAALRLLTDAGTWATEASMPDKACFLASGTIRGVVYAVGGTGGGNPTNALQIYRAVENGWEVDTKAPMPTARDFLAAGVIDNILYVVGGANASGSLSTVEAFNPATNLWSEKSPMPTPRSGLSVGILNGTLYAVGGTNNSGVLTTVEAYDPTTDVWTEKSPAPPSFLGGIGIAQGVMYLIQGNGSANVYAYNQAGDQWNQIANLPTPRGSLAVAGYRGRLYTLGGDSLAPQSIYNTVEVYHPKEGVWSEAPPMPTPRACLSATVRGNTLYALGGEDGGKDLTTVEGYTIADP